MHEAGWGQAAAATPPPLRVAAASWVLADALG